MKPSTEQSVGLIFGPYAAQVTMGDTSGVYMADYIEHCVIDMLDVARSAIKDEHAVMEHNAPGFVSVIEIARFCLGMAVALRAQEGGAA